MAVELEDAQPPAESVMVAPRVSRDVVGARRARWSAKPNLELDAYGRLGLAAQQPARHLRQTPLWDLFEAVWRHSQGTGGSPAARTRVFLGYT